MFKTILFLVIIYAINGCTPHSNAGSKVVDKEDIKSQIQNEINILIQSVNRKDLATYMAKMPLDFIIYDENGEVISREKQREFVIRDWAIIKRTLNNEMRIDSIDFIDHDSVFVYTFQKWERLMFQRDGIMLDTVITTQKHRELWKNKGKGWMGYDVEELGGEVFINGEKYVL